MDTKLCKKCGKNFLIFEGSPRICKECREKKEEGKKNTKSKSKEAKNGI